MNTTQNNLVCNDIRVQGISAVLIVCNAVRTIDQCLQALNGFEEVIVCDTGSSDDTIDYLQGRSNVRLFQIEFDGFGSAKNQAVAKATNNWIFSIDADEIVDAELFHTLVAWDTGGDEYCLGTINRRNFFMGRHIKHGGWGHQRVIRLFNRKTHQFSNAKVHEKIIEHPRSRKTFLAGGVDHFTIPDISTYLNKIRDYSEFGSLTAKVNHPVLILLRTLYTFIRSYLLYLGWMDGWRGLIIAWCTANGTFFKYMRAYVRSKNANPTR